MTTKPKRCLYLPHFSCLKEGLNVVSGFSMFLTRSLSTYFQLTHKSVMPTVQQLLSAMTDQISLNRWIYQSDTNWHNKAAAMQAQHYAMSKDHQPALLSLPEYSYVTYLKPSGKIYTQRPTTKRTYKYHNCHQENEVPNASGKKIPFWITGTWSVSLEFTLSSQQVSRKLSSILN